jgi:hypothetical protein
MLEHGKPGVRKLVPQLDRARVLPNRCPCGCASIDFGVDGQPKPFGGLLRIADFVFAGGEESSGILVFEQSCHFELCE